MTRLSMTFAALALASASPLLLRAVQRPSAPQDIQQVDVYVGGEGAYHTYRIPSLLLTPRGTLLAFAEARRETGADSGDIDLVVKRSRDGGRSWSAMQVIGDNGPNTFGNPCPVVDRSTGTIWLLSTQNAGSDKEAAIVDVTSKGTRTVWVMKSVDDGETWSEPREITGQVKRADWTWYATGPGVGIQTRSGRLVIPANHSEAGTKASRSHLFYSDDHGATWQLGAVSDPGTNESQVAELSDGRLMLNMRNHPPKPVNYRMIAISRDAGQTLSAAEPDSTLVEPPAQASLVSVPPASNGGRAGWLLFANPAAATRTRMTVRLSRDNGATWNAGRVVHEGPSAYSSLAVFPDATAGLLYERGDRSPYERLAFARLALESLAR
jgi:sialidase-1